MMYDQGGGYEGAFPVSRGDGQPPIQPHGVRLRAVHAVALCGSVAAYGLSPGDIAALQSIAGGEHAWSKAEALKQGGTSDETLVSLESRTWIVGWDVHGEPAFSLSPWAAEILNLELIEHWEFYTALIKQEDCDGVKTESVVRHSTEVPRWCVKPAEVPKGEPKPKKKPLVLPLLHQQSYLPPEIIEGLVSPHSDPVSEAIINEEFAMQDAMTKEGTLDVDEATGLVRRVPVILFPAYAPDQGKIPRAKGARKRGKGKRRGKKRKASDSGGSGGTSAPDEGDSGRPAA